MAEEETFSYFPGAAKKKAAEAGWATVMKRRAKRAAGKAAAAEAAAAEATAANSWTGLLKAGNIKGMLKKPGGVIGALFLAQMLASHLMRGHQERKAMGIQSGMMEAQAERSPEDAYYQAAMPELSAERQQAQDALMQMILAGRGQDIQVPGERRI